MTEFTSTFQQDKYFARARRCCFYKTQQNISFADCTRLLWRLDVVSHFEATSRPLSRSPTNVRASAYTRRDYLISLINWRALRSTICFQATPAIVLVNGIFLALYQCHCQNPIVRSTLDVLIRFVSRLTEFEVTRLL